MLAQQVRGSSDSTNFCRPSIARAPGIVEPLAVDESDNKRSKMNIVGGSRINLLDDDEKLTYAGVLCKSHRQSYMALRRK